MSLEGKTIVITRPRQQAEQLAAALVEHGAECLLAPTIKIMPLADYSALAQALAKIEQYNWLIFTSINGVKHFFSRLPVYGKSLESLSGMRVAAIGAATAQTLLSHGVRADIVPVEYRAEGLVLALTGLIRPGDKVLIPRAAQAREVLPEGLRKLGATVDVVPVYQTAFEEDARRQLREHLTTGVVDMVTFTSPSAVSGLLTALGRDAKELLTKTAIACIGPITAATCMDHGLIPAVVAENFTVGGLVAAIIDYYACR